MSSRLLRVQTVFEVFESRKPVCSVLHDSIAAEDPRHAAFRGESSALLSPYITLLHITRLTTNHSRKSRGKSL